MYCFVSAVPSMSTLIIRRGRISALIEFRTIYSLVRVTTERFLLPLTCVKLFDSIDSFSMCNATSDRRLSGQAERFAGFLVSRRLRLSKLPMERVLRECIGEPQPKSVERIEEGCNILL